MFKLGNTNKKNLLTFGLSLLVGLGISIPQTLSAKENKENFERSVDGAYKYKIKDNKYGPYHVNTQNVKNYNSGRLATKNEINAWNTDVRPDGEGLPEYEMHNGEIVKDENGKPIKAEGSVELGNELYDMQCAMCHGEFGAGGRAYPKLTGGEFASLKLQRLNPADESPNPMGPDKTVGSYWPFASTLYWYIQESMPFTAPKTLTNSETYAITAYLLYENGITVDGEEMDEEFVMDKEKMLKVEMKNKDGFYPKVDTENPKEGVENMRKLLSNPKIYGTGTRCMSNCIEKEHGKEKKVEDLLLKIKIPLDDKIVQPVSTERTLPKIKEENKEEEHEGKKLYDTYGCVACHGNPALGAPVVGDKDAWENVKSKGIQEVYYNAINGINAMPPKGGIMDMPDEELKKIVDYMIEISIK